MRTDSCRKCGKELSIVDTCNICEKPNIFECKNCGLQTEEQIHRDCILTSLHYHLLKVTI